MKFSKVFYIAAVLLLFPAVLSAQTASITTETPIVSIQDLHKATGTDLLVEDGLGNVTLSQEYYNTKAIPNRVAKLIKESLLEDTMLAAQTKKEFKGHDTQHTTVAQAAQEDVAVLDTKETTTLSNSITAGGGLE